MQADFLWYKQFCFSGLTSNTPLILNRYGHVISILNAVKCFLFKKTFSVSVLFQSSMVVFSIFPNPWQAATWNLSRYTPFSFSRAEPKMPEKSKHSLLEYCSNLSCCISSFTSLLFVVLNSSYKTWLVNSSFCFISKSNLDVISNNIFLNLPILL